MLSYSLLLLFLSIYILFKMDAQQITILITSLIIFSISLFITVQQFIYLYNESRLVTIKSKSEYSEKKLDISFIIMMISLFSFITTIKYF